MGKSAKISSHQYVSWVAYCIERESELVLVDYFRLPLYKGRKEAACVVVKLIYVWNKQMTRLTSLHCCNLWI